MLRSGPTSYYQADGLGSITSLSSTAGALAQTYTFDSFGNQTASSGSLTNSFRYTAREFDTETDLYFYRARYYGPSTGRFLSEDPLDFDAGTNFYDYVANNPTVFIDPFGLWHCAGDVDCNLTPDLKKGLDCFDKCTNRETVVTSGRRPPSHKHPNGSHSRGEACDLGRNHNPGLDPNKARQCFLNCFPHGYGQEENKQDGKGTHYHFQVNTVPGGTPRFATGIQPYDP